MPVILDCIDQSQAQDLIDLEKIYADYPTDLRWPDVQKKLAQNPGLKLYAGRFNDRLLGAVTAQKDGEKLILDDFCVRSITRKRSVARDILRLLLEQETAQHVELTLCQESPGMDKLLKNAGFSVKGNTYSLSQA